MRIHCDGRIFGLQRHGGVHRATRNLIEAMHRRQDVNLRTVMPSELAGDESWLPPHTVTQLPAPVRLRPARVLGSLAARFNQRRHAAVWAGLKDGVYLGTYYSTHPSLKIPQINVIHDMIYERFPDLTQTARQEFHKREKLECIRAAQVLVCPSQSARDDLEALCDVSGKTVAVIPWGVESHYRPIDNGSRLERFRQLHTAGAPFLLYVGGRDGTKNFTPLLMAYSRWPGRRDVRLLAVGGGAFSNQEHSVLRALRLREHVHCVPALPNDELIVAYNAAAACVMPSQYEGFGFPVLEAMACGVPVAASNASSLPEVGGDAAVYFDPTDNDAIRDSLSVVTQAGDQARRRALGLARAAELTWDRCAAEFVALMGSHRP